MRARRDMAGDGNSARINLGERLDTLHVGGKRIAMGEHEPRHSIGQRRLADALCAPINQAWGMRPLR